MTKKQTVTVSMIKDVLKEADKGLMDSTRTVKDIKKLHTKSVVKNGISAAAKAGVGGVAVATAATTAAALSAGGLGAAGFAGGTMTFLAGSGAVTAAGGAFAILGGPIGWIIGGTAFLLTVGVGVAAKSYNKKLLARNKDALMHEVMQKQNMLIREQEVAIKDLKQKQREMKGDGAEMQAIINNLIDHIDYLTGMLVSLTAIKKACSSV